MLRAPPQTREATDWCLAAGWTVVIYAVIPFARAVQEWVYQHLGRAAFSVTVYACVAAGVAALGWLALRGRIALTRRRWVAVWLVAAAYAAGTHHLRRSPEEAMHFVEYGVLSFLVFRAFTHRLRDPAIYVAAVLLGVLLGTVDEIIQWITPRRFFDFRDIAINASAVVLMQLGIGAGLAPAYIAGPVRARSARICRRMAALLLALLFLLVGNTPARMRAYQQRLPFLRFLDEAMIEYGYRYEDPEAGTFVSRLPPARLQREDADRAAEAGRILREEGSDGAYEKFLARHTPVNDPFLHELRVHLFRRDRYWKDARDKRSDPAEHAALITVAWHEQLILERHFGASLRASGFDWPPDLRDAARADAVPGAYVSPVSAQLITRVSERDLQALCVGLLLVALFVERYYVRRERVNA